MHTGFPGFQGVGRKTRRPFLPEDTLQPILDDVHLRFVGKAELPPAVFRHESMTPGDDGYNAGAIVFSDYGSWYDARHIARHHVFRIISEVVVDNHVGFIHGDADKRLLAVEKEKYRQRDFHARGVCPSFQKPIHPDANRRTCNRMRL